MNKIEIMRAFLDGETCVASDGILFKLNDNGRLLSMSNGGDWDFIDYNDIPNSKFFTWKVYKAPKREFNIKPTDWVLVRDDNEAKWGLNVFSHIAITDKYLYQTITGGGYCQIAPYKGNESKLNTTDDIADKFTKDDL